MYIKQLNANLLKAIVKESNEKKSIKIKYNIDFPYVDVLNSIEKKFIFHIICC